MYLETDRLILRKFKESDYKAMFENWASDGDVAKNAGWPKHENPEDTKGLVKMWVDEYKEENTFSNRRAIKKVDRKIKKVIKRAAKEQAKMMYEKTYDLLYDVIKANFK